MWARRRKTAKATRTTIMNGGMDSGSASLLIRPVTRNDAEAVTELLGQLGYQNDGANVLRRIESFHGPDDAVFVAEFDRRVLGLASLHRIPFFHTSGSMARITSFVVDTSVHRRGVGRALLQRVDQWAREKGCERIEVTSGDHRTIAHTFYQAMGYEFDQRRFIRAVR